MTPSDRKRGKEVTHLFFGSYKKFSRRHSPRNISVKSFYSKSCVIVSYFMWTPSLLLTHRFICLWKLSTIAMKRNYKTCFAVLCGTRAHIGPRSPLFYVYIHTFRHPHTPNRASLTQWSALCRRHYLHNTQQTQLTSMHAFNGTGIRDPNNQKAVDLRVRPQGHRDRLRVYV
jgi:hypothetical protein